MSVAIGSRKTVTGQAYQAPSSAGMASCTMAAFKAPDISSTTRENSQARATAGIVNTPRYPANGVIKIPRNKDRKNRPLLIDGHRVQALIAADIFSCFH
ncbi:MAG: hypothetical protein EKK40_15940 [Bradyrhizobiaceae bacterium]|nr:MAG: hypothetical protein EKK40_15940 [Bradyrhizobiaceae bacterium]